MSERERGEEGRREGGGGIGGEGLRATLRKRREEEEEEEREKGWRKRRGLSCAGVLSSEGRGCWETNESSRHLVHTGDCLSIQIAVFRPA